VLVDIGVPWSFKVAMIFSRKCFSLKKKKKTQREFGFVNALGDDGIPVGGGVGFTELDQYAGPNSWSNQDRPYPTRI
jgi:hypothetical protein